jgi:hypothetical protein
LGRAMAEGEQRQAERWNPTAPGQTVRLRDNPGRQGTTTGCIKQAGAFLMVEVDFGLSEKLFKRAELLEPIAAREDAFDLMAAGSYGGPIDLRRILIVEKIKGEPTRRFLTTAWMNLSLDPCSCTADNRPVS